jgi:hypothetical protein
MTGYARARASDAAVRTLRGVAKPSSNSCSF